MNVSNKKLREFGFIVSIIFPFLFGWLIPVLNNHGFRFWTVFYSSHTTLICFYPRKIILLLQSFNEIRIFVRLDQ